TGATRVQSARWENTLELFGYAARVKPSGLAYQNLGAHYINNKEPEKAEESFRQALASIPHQHRPFDHNTSRVATGLARALYDQGKVSEAEHQLRAVLQIFPESWEAMRFLANLLINED